MEIWSRLPGGRINEVGSHYGTTCFKHVLRMNTFNCARNHPFYGHFSTLKPRFIATEQCLQMKPSTWTQWKLPARLTVFCLNLYKPRLRLCILLNFALNNEASQINFS